MSSGDTLNDTLNDTLGDTLNTNDFYSILLDSIPESEIKKTYHVRKGDFHWDNSEYYTDNIEKLLLDIIKESNSNLAQYRYSEKELIEENVTEEDILYVKENLKIPRKFMDGIWVKISEVKCIEINNVKYCLNVSKLRDCC